jgi:hypothetical protein
LSVIEGLDPGYLNAGLMKPRRGLTPTVGKEKLGVGKAFQVIAKIKGF